MFQMNSATFSPSDRKLAVDRGLFIAQMVTASKGSFFFVSEYAYKMSNLLRDINLCLENKLPALITQTCHLKHADEAVAVQIVWKSDGMYAHFVAFDKEEHGSAMLPQTSEAFIEEWATGISQ